MKKRYFVMLITVTKYSKRMTSNIRKVLTELLSIRDVDTMRECIIDHLRDISPLEKIDVEKEDYTDISFLPLSGEDVDEDKAYTAEEFLKKLFTTMSITRTQSNAYEVKVFDASNVPLSSSSSFINHNGSIGRMIVYNLVLTHNTYLFHSLLGFFHVTQTYSVHRIIKDKASSPYETHLPLLSSDHKIFAIRASLYLLMDKHLTSEDNLVAEIMDYPFEKPFESASEVRQILRDMGSPLYVETDDDGIVWYGLDK